MSAAIAVSVTSAWYGRARALGNVAFEVDEGSALGIVGHNGVGKTTLLRTIARVHRQAEGDVKLHGTSVFRATSYEVAMMGVGFVREGAPVFTQLKVDDNLKLGQRLAVRRRKAPLGTADLYERFPTLRDLRDRKAGVLSGGQRQMLALATALAGNPAVLLLDEPSAGLSPEAARGVFKAIAELSELGLSVVIAEQNQRWLSGVTSRAIELSEGMQSGSLAVGS